MKNKPFITVVIPVEGETKYLKEALNCYSKQTYSNFEVIISSSMPFSTSYSFVRVVADKNLARDVASKRNKILKFDKGEVFVFNDDDVFVPKNYLKEIVSKFKNPKILAAAGPLLTPDNDSFLQQASGAIWESYFGLGSLGAGIHRSKKCPSKIVYDYPAANLIIRKQAFTSIGGFEKGLYPGEDTKLCLLLFNKYKVGVAYDPKLFVFHHRKSLFKDHLQQIGRYGKQRGWFVLSYPETSFKIQYFLPSIFLLYILSLVFIFPIFKPYILPLIAYIITLFIEGVVIFYHKKEIRLAIISIIGIVLTHLYYGYRFLKSFMSKIFQKI